MADHREEMDKLKRLSGREQRRLVRQLLHAKSGVWRGRSRKGGLSPELSSAYDAALDRVEEFARRAASIPSIELERFRQALALLQSGCGVMALAKDGDMEIEGLGVYEALLTRSWEVRYTDPREMCHLARAAVEVAEQLNPEVHGGIHTVVDLQARAWGELANAHRVANRYYEAEQAFGMAFGLVRQGSGDPRLLTRLLSLEASLLGTLREFELALPRLANLAELSRKAGDLHQAGRALIKKALYTFYNGNTLEALRISSAALSLIEEERDPSLAMVAIQNQLLFLVDCGRYKEARKILFKNRVRLYSLGHLAQLKVRGIEGRIDYGLQQLDGAETAFREVKAGFEEAEMGFACALAGFDLAMTLMRQDRGEEATAEALQAAAMFEALSIHRELLGVVIYLEEEFRARRGTLMLLESTVRYLRRRMLELGEY
ncbi:MAG TPA: hypothetical protein VGX68_26655 [Thermoanaerobaculia bacterium]|nr:hypothetical protein [Thermoanaerobaculia bacterium]